MTSLIRLLPAQLAHDMAPRSLRALSAFKSPESFTWRSNHWKGLHFKNPLGVAGGVDKTGQLVDVWQKWGAGFTEVGTITPKPQKANPGTVVMRDWDKKLLWNRLGFPSPGFNTVLESLKQFQRTPSFPVFVNIGKNRETPLEKAFEDYGLLAKEFKDLADVFVINVSSPNTQGLRQLQQSEYLRDIIKAVRSNADKTPCLLKLSPDLEQGDLERVLTAAKDSKIDGFILTNTTLQRPDGSHFPSDGGLSGQYLSQISKKFLRQALSILGSEKDQFLIVSAGGILNSDDVKERLDLGAQLLQVYSALVFSGPQFFKRTYQELHRKAL